MPAWILSALLLSPAVDADLDRLIAQSRVPSARVSVAVGRAGEAPVYFHRADVARVPASNQKILTAAAALRIMGRDYKFETRVVRLPDGGLGVRGEGDPNFSGRFFDGDAAKVMRHLARDVRGKGVVAVEGDLVLDASRFDDAWVHPDWPADQLERWYCAPVAALVYNDSCWDVKVAPAKGLGELAQVTVLPSLLRPRIANRCATVADRKSHVVHIGRAKEAGLVVRGGILLDSPGIEQNIAVRDPVRFFGDALRAALEAEGVPVRGAVVRGSVAGKDIVVYRSSLERTLKVTLTRSQNLYAECIFKHLGAKGTFEDGSAAVKRVLQQMKIPTAGLSVADGSGLARSNRVSARTLFGVLQAMAEETMFVTALAAGGEGTLRRRFRDLGDRVRLKTGTIRGASCLSGYVTDAGGVRWVMVVMCNSGDLGSAIRLQNSIVHYLAARP